MVTEAETETTEFAALVEAIALIDTGLSSLQSREIVAASEVTDLLLDIRTLLAPVPGALDEPALPVGSN
jgi:hypothetical protein